MLKKWGVRAGRFARIRSSSLPWFAILILSFAILTVAIVVGNPLIPALFVPLFVAAGLFLTGNGLRSALSTATLSYLVATGVTWKTNVGDIAVVFITVVILALVVILVRSRVSLGVPIAASPALLGDLRERLDIQARVPLMPHNYHVEHCVLPSRGAFSGDFVVSARRGNHFQLALADVSGSGPAAAVRALLLSGALSGILCEVGPDGYLQAANRYLIRQGWRDGFASAMHLAVELDAGEYSLGSAGHPTAAHFQAATGQWSMVEGAGGLLLGLFDQGPEGYVRGHGVLAPGDALLMYSDGVVEGPDGDLEAGTQRLLGIARDVMSISPYGAAERICLAAANEMSASKSDDRTVVLMWRDAE